MTVTALPVRDEFTGTAGQTVFNYTFLIFTANDLNVYITPAGQDANDSTDLTTAYTVDPGTIGNPVGGFITLNSGVSAGDLVTIVSSIVEDRTTDYQNSGDFLPDTVNEDFDRVVSLTKQQSDRSGRTLAFEESVQNATDLTLPTPDGGLYLAWKGDESGVENVGAPGAIQPSELNGTTVQMVANASLVAGEFIITSGYGSSGDGGDNIFLSQAVTGATADGGSLIKGVGNVAIEFVGLFPGGVFNTEQWGAVGGISVDSTATAQAAIDYMEGLSGGNLTTNNNFYISAPLTVNFAKLKWDFASARTETTGRSGIIKLAGFTGNAALIVGDGINGFAGFDLNDCFIDGNFQAGTGLQVLKVGNVSLTNVNTSKHNEWGMQIDGSFLFSMTECVIKTNGVSGVSGGGLRWSNISRENAQPRMYACTLNKNNNHQMFSDIATSSTVRLAGLMAYGCMFELPEDGDSTTALVELKSADRCAFFGCYFPNEAGVTKPCLIVGDIASPRTIEDLSFYSCYFQHSSAGAEFAIVTTDNVESMSFYDPRFEGNNKLLDASASTTGIIQVFGGTVPTTSYNDPNDVIGSVGIGDGVLGYTAGTAGTEFVVRPREDGIPVWLQCEDASGTTRSLKMNHGASENQVNFEGGLYPRLPPIGTEPPGATSGVIAFSSSGVDVGNGFGGAGVGFYGFVNPSWVKL